MFPAIALDQVAFGYSGNGHFVFEDFSLSVEKGEFRAILGANGSGKSTLSRLISGILRPTRGEVRIDGVTINASTRQNPFKRVGLVFQNSDHGWITSSVEEEIAFGLCQLGLDQCEITRRVSEALERFNLTALAKRPPAWLSGGEKKRASIAAVWVLQPDIWLLDEPMAMLDAAGRSFVHHWIREMQAEDKTLLYFGHRLDEVMVANKVSVLSNHRIIWEGAPDELARSAQETWEVTLPEPLRLYRAISGDDKASEVLTQEELVKALWG